MMRLSAKITFEIDLLDSPAEVARAVEVLLDQGYTVLDTVARPQAQGGLTLRATTPEVPFAQGSLSAAASVLKRITGQDVTVWTPEEPSEAPA